MKTALVTLIKILSMGFLSSGIFMAANIVAPLKTKTSQRESQLPRLTVSFKEFSPSFAAFEDDYYVADAPPEKIPADIKAVQLVLDKIDMMDGMKSEEKISLPQLTMNPVLAVRETLQETQNPAAAAAARLPAESGVQVPHHWLQGKIELSGGLAISDSRDQIRVGWVHDGQALNTAKIDLREGTYEIKVQSLEGDLIAELADSKGFILGEAVIDLDALAKERGRDQLLMDNVDIKIEPYHFGFRGQALSVYDTPTNRSPVAQVVTRVGKHDLYFKADEKGKIVDETVSQHSTAVITASRSQFRDTLLLADFERSQNIRMFPEKFLKAFFDTLKVDSKDRDGGLIWGVVNKDNTPSSGYQVRLVDHPEAVPVYFTMYIATRDLKSTSTDGQFAFTGILDGDYELEVINSMDQKVDSKLISVRSGFVTQAEFEVAKRKTVAVRPFDPLSSTRKDVQLSALGSDAIHDIRTEEILRIPVFEGSDPFLIYTRPVNAKTDSSVFATRNSKFLDIPVLNTEWWERIQAQNKIQVKGGVVIGFIDTEARFEVFVEDSQPQTKILYFNHIGEIIPHGSHELANGFIVYSLGDGLKTLVLQSESGFITTEMAFLDGESVSLMYKAL